MVAHSTVLLDDSFLGPAVLSGKSRVVSKQMQWEGFRVP